MTAVSTQAGLSEKVYLLNHAFHHGLAASHHPCSVPVKNDDDLVKLQNCIYTFALANQSRLWKDNSQAQFTMQILHSLSYWLCRKDIINVRPVIRLPTRILYLLDKTPPSSKRRRLKQIINKRRIRINVTPNQNNTPFVQGIINLKQPDNRDYFSAIKRDIGTLNIFLFYIIFTNDLP